jgi:hypothetical protein
MIALENLKEVSYKKKPKSLGNIKNWNWVPNISNLKKAERVLEASLQTSRKTGSQQTDHGEGW